MRRRRKCAGELRWQTVSHTLNTARSLTVFSNEFNNHVVTDPYYFVANRSSQVSIDVLRRRQQTSETEVGQLTLGHL